MLEIYIETTLETNIGNDNSLVETYSTKHKTNFSINKDKKVV